MDAAFDYHHISSVHADRLQSAYHHAAYAIAIYLRNKLFNLPPVYFQIKRSDVMADNAPPRMYQNQSFTLEGGRLIDPLTVSMKTCCEQFSVSDQAAFKSAFEADIINLLVGAYAEIKFINHTGRQKLNRQPVNFRTLKDYFEPYEFDCGKSYLEYFYDDLRLREQKIADLCNSANIFVNQGNHWQLIGKLAEFLVHEAGDRCTCEQVQDYIDGVYKPVAINKAITMG